MNCIAVFNSGVQGTVRFINNYGMVDIVLDIQGLKPNSFHGFHVHTYGDLSDGCTSACDHFNPFNQTHGCPGMENRHVGDLGNIQTDIFGNANYKFSDNVISLTPGHPCSIVGRMLIIHQDRDDCGSGGNPESLKTGNAGKRIACAVIGYSS